MNDVVLSLDAQTLTPPLAAQRFNRVRLRYVQRLGAELFAAEPLLPHTDEEKARRLAVLIAAKAPQINAALFIAPSRHCRPDEVIVRFASLSFEVMGDLVTRQNLGRLNTVTADRAVWRRLAA